MKTEWKRRRKSLGSYAFRMRNGYWTADAPWPRKNGAVALFNLAQDPSEKSNLAQSEPERTGKLLDQGGALVVTDTRAPSNEA